MPIQCPSDHHLPYDQTIGTEGTELGSSRERAAVVPDLIRVSVRPMASGTDILNMTVNPLTYRHD